MTRKKEEEEMLERKHDLQSGQMLLKEECSKVKIREINLKTKEDSFEKLRNKGEKQMLG